MKNKLQTSSHEIVIQQPTPTTTSTSTSTDTDISHDTNPNGDDPNGTSPGMINITLGEVFHQLGLSEHDISLGTLDMNANNTFQRFDRFNLKYNPAGQSLLREIFLKTDNFLNGKYLAEITQEVLCELEKGNNKYTILELRLSIYGKHPMEWMKLSQWFTTYQLAHENVRWMIQIPRLYESYVSSSTSSFNDHVITFQDLLENIFAPLVEVTLNPSSNLQLFSFLDTIRGFDCVDDESKPEYGNMNSIHTSENLPSPNFWTRQENPPYGYWLYYLYANIATLNQLRVSRGMSTFLFRPHCGEAGDVDHLISAYLLTHEINHGIVLEQSPALHYLYYLSQIGIAMSPLSNNRLFLSYQKNPFLTYFQQGLNGSLPRY
jgi:AMP deaminase